MSGTRERQHRQDNTKDRAGTLPINLDDDDVGGNDSEEGDAFVDAYLETV